MAMAKPIIAPFGGKGINRRPVLATVPPATAPASKGMAPSRALRLFNEYQALLAGAAAHIPAAVTPLGEDAEFERRFFRRSRALEAELMETPSTTAADFAAKLIVAMGNGEYFPDTEDCPIWREARALTGFVEHD